MSYILEHSTGFGAVSIFLLLISWVLWNTKYSNSTPPSSSAPSLLQKYAPSLVPDFAQITGANAGLSGKHDQGCEALTLLSLAED